MALGDFTNQAAAYARGRPDYPEAMLDQLLAIADFPTTDDGADDRAVVVDLGAGTGIFSCQLVARGLSVTAVEPNDAMREHAITPASVTFVAGTFEATTLADSCCDLAIASQSFHWADPPRALPEIRRILRRPGSVFCAFWNNRLNDESAVLTFTRATIQRIVPDMDGGYRDRDWPTELTATGDFIAADPAIIEVRHEVAYTRERYLDLWHSHNRLAETAGPDRLQQVLTAIGGWFDEQGVDEVSVPYNCRAFVVRRV